jgi:transcription elongation factor Elf1
MSSFICPYCDKELDTPTDCYETNEDYEWQCEHCEKYFVFTIDYDIIYYESKADCLNGADHNYQKTLTIPEEFARLRCKMCGDEKPLPRE